MEERQGETAVWPEKVGGSSDEWDGEGEAAVLGCQSFDKGLELGKEFFIQGPLCKSEVSQGLLAAIQKGGGSRQSALRLLCNLGFSVLRIEPDNLR